MHRIHAITRRGSEAGPRWNLLQQLVELSVRQLGLTILDAADLPDGLTKHVR
jgi:hypothetical protein